MMGRTCPRSGCGLPKSDRGRGERNRPRNIQGRGGQGEALITPLSDRGGRAHRTPASGPYRWVGVFKLPVREKFAHRRRLGTSIHRGREVTGASKDALPACKHGRRWLAIDHLQTSRARQLVIGKCFFWADIVRGRAGEQDSRALLGKDTPLLSALVTPRDKADR